MVEAGTMKCNKELPSAAKAARFALPAVSARLKPPCPDVRSRSRPGGLLWGTSGAKAPASWACVMSPLKGRPKRRSSPEMSGIAGAPSIEGMRRLAVWGTGRIACATSSTHEAYVMVEAGTMKCNKELPSAVKAA